MIEAFVITFITATIVLATRNPKPKIHVPRYLVIRDVVDERERTRMIEELKAEADEGIHNSHNFIWGDVTAYKHSGGFSAVLGKCIKCDLSAYASTEAKPYRDNSIPKGLESKCKG